jgi:signal transduction histidine kinase
MPRKQKKLRYIFLLYWILLGYIIAALIWWFIALNAQNHQMTIYKISHLKMDDYTYLQDVDKLNDAEKRKTAQYIGEGITFLLLIFAGAIFVFRVIRRQLKFGLEQQNFMMALTHELKTPIAVAKLNLETLQKRKLDETQQQRLIQTTLQEANRLNALCNNMLLSSQFEAGGYLTTFEETNFSELADNCVQDFIVRFPHRAFQRDIAPELFVNGDRLLLQMAVNNLIDNAIKYSPKETPIVITLKERDKTTIALSVKDEGKGIETDEKQKVFSKFYRIGNAATKAAKGTGLGLFLTKKIVQQHKGNISVTDNNPTGAIFTILLPTFTEKD